MSGFTNVTVKVDPHVLAWAHLRALQYGTSVNRVLADALLALARRPRPPDFPLPPAGDIQPPPEVAHAVPMDAAEEASGQLIAASSLVVQHEEL